MNLKKYAIFFLSSVFLLAACAGGLRAEGAPDRGQELFDFFIRSLSPEHAVLQLSRAPGEDGSLPWGYLECTNANVRGMNVQSFRMDCFEAVMTPPAQWKDVSHPKVTSMLACHAEAVFTEKDVNAFLESRLFGHDKEWERAHVEMKDGRIRATAYYRVNLRLFRMKIKTEVSCRLVGRGTGLYLDDVRLKINNSDVSPGLVERALHRLQPFIDMQKYGLPLSFSKIEVSDGMCRASTRIPPRELPHGLLWDYPAGRYEVPFDNR